MCSFVRQVYNSSGILPPKELKCYNLETTFQKKVIFSQYVRFIRSYYLINFQIPVATTLMCRASKFSCVLCLWNFSVSFSSLIELHITFLITLGELFLIGAPGFLIVYKSLAIFLIHHYHWYHSPSELTCSASHSDPPCNDIWSSGEFF